MEIAGYNLKQKTVTEIGKFAILWNRFEHFTCNKRCSPSKIIHVGKSISIDETKVNNFREAVKNRMELCDEDTISYVTDGLYPDGAKKIPNEETQQIIEQNMKQFIDNTKPNNIPGCLLVIYRIRNNMMHGLKDISELDEQFELFQAANGVLEELPERSL